MSFIWTSVYLAVRIVFLGAAWVPLSSETEERERLNEFFLDMGKVVSLGVLLNLLSVLVLAQAGSWTPVWGWAAWGALLCAGAWRTRGRCFKSKRLKVLAGELVLVILTVLSVLVFPPRSEWLAGGWDPGIYQNNAVAVANRSGLLPASGTIYSKMTEEERIVFSVASGSYHEILPAVPIRIESGELPLYFFQMTPVCGAWLFRAGGLALLNRLPGLLSVMGLWLVCSVAVMLGLKGWRIGVCLVMWCLSPMWWYHQAVPSSETLYVFLVFGALLFYLRSMQEGHRLPVAAGLFMFAAVINHLNFMVVGPGLLMVAAAAEVTAGAKGRSSRIVFCLVALSLGAAWDLLFAGSTIHKLHARDQVLWLVLGPFLVLAGMTLAVLWMPVQAGWRKGIEKIVLLGILIAACCTAVLIGLLCVPCAREALFKAVEDAALIKGFMHRVYRLMVFNGFSGYLFLAAGMVYAAWDRSSSYSLLRVSALAFGVVTLLFLISGRVAWVYPWALRRYFIVALPFAVFVQSYLLVRILERWREIRAGMRLLFCVCAALVIVDQSRIIYSAARVGDYIGLSDLIEKFDSHIQSNDLVVADDPRWGTPLLLCRGRNVLDGRQLWKSEDAEYNKTYLRILCRLRTVQGGRVLWLTSTDSGMQIYSAQVGPTSAIFEKMPFSYRTVIHSAQAKRFAVKDNRRVFGLYEWRPDESRGPIPSLTD